MSLTTAMFNPPTIDKDRILSMVDVDPRRIWNIYLYGSRVYGTCDSDSDYDFLVLASSLHEHTELNDGTYNIHIITADKFQDNMRKYKMGALECVFAPKFARIKETTDYRSTFIISNYLRMKKTILNESHSAWVGGKMKLREGDIHRGTKSIFHSLRILLFGLQMIEYGEIIDFSEANYYWQEISDVKGLEWEVFRDKFLPLKKDLEKMVKE